MNKERKKLSAKTTWEKGRRAKVVLEIPSEME